MLRSLKKMCGYRVDTRDGEMGHVHDFYFDDHHWVIRYLVVDTGSWLPGPKVLVSPGKLAEPDWEEEVLPVKLTRDEVRQAPGIETDLPVSLQEGFHIDMFPLWAPFWAPNGSYVGGLDEVPANVYAYARESETNPGDPCLRSVKEIIGYDLEEPDNNLGSVVDVLADTGNWTIRYLVVDTGNWLPGRKVILAPQWIRAIDWQEEKVEVELSGEEIANSPEYDPEAPLDRDYETSLYHHYDRPGYWKK